MRDRWAPVVTPAGVYHTEPRPAAGNGAKLPHIAGQCTQGGMCDLTINRTSSTGSVLGWVRTVWLARYHTVRYIARSRRDFHAASNS